MQKAKTYDYVERELYFTEITKKTNNRIGIKYGKQLPLFNINKDRLYIK